jgi:5-methylcytosine-specific restriction enzyme subunit McrC
MTMRAFILLPRSDRTVKYKDKPNRPDINQAITYAISYRSDRVLLVYQNQPGATAGLVHIGTVSGIRVEGYGFDLGSDTLEQEEIAFCDCLFSMVASGTGI